jgi:phosphatidylinositol-3-phosphatase
MSRVPGLVLVAFVALGQLSCGHAQPSARLALPTHLPKPTSSHVVTIVMENKEFGDVIGSPDAPYVNRLAKRYGLATASYGVRHPSLPDYLALTSGSTHGIESDCTDCHVAARNIVDQLEKAKLSWKAYMEDLPRACFGGAGAGRYAKKHDPFMYYDDVARDRVRCRRVVPLTRLGRDLRRGRLPTYAFISPNLCNDTHDCSVATGDQFLAQLMPTLLRAVGPEGYIVLTWDEGTSNRGCCGGSAGGRIPTIVAGRLVRRGARLHAPLDHYGVLRTTEDTLGLRRMGAARQRRHGSLNRLFRRLPALASASAR